MLSYLKIKKLGYYIDSTEPLIKATVSVKGSNLSPVCPSLKSWICLASVFHYWTSVPPKINTLTVMATRAQYIIPSHEQSQEFLQCLCITALVPQIPYRYGWQVRVFRKICMPYY
jgi:hypothetical protein